MIGLLLLIAIIALALAYVANDDVDKCLDSGGRWDEATEHCQR